jgi:hypothetical protein
MKKEYENSARIDVLEAKLNVLLLITGGQFIGILGIIIAVLTS